MNDLAELLDGLIDCWCDRRELKPLRILLPAWPMMAGALTDDWERLRSALRWLRGSCRDDLPEAELVAIGKSIALVDSALESRDK